jgi:protoglobin
VLQPFLAKKGESDEEVRLMLEAWRKCVILQVAIWSHAYAKEGDW